MTQLSIQRLWSRNYSTTDGQPVSTSWCRAHSGSSDLILLPVGGLMSESCSLVSVGRPLRREDGSAACSAITQWSESRRTRNHTLLSHLRFPQPGGPGSCISSWNWSWSHVRLAVGQSVSQYVLVSSPLWDLRPDINYVWKLLSCLCGAPSLMRDRVYFLSVTVSNICLSFVSVPLNIC
jgi:hypothetical protein